MGVYYRFMKENDKYPLNKLEEFLRRVENRDWEGAKAVVDDLCHTIIDKERWRLIMFKGEKEYVLDIFSRLSRKISFTEILLNEIFHETDDQRKNRVLREIKLLLLEAVWKNLGKGQREIILPKIKEETTWLENALLISNDVELLFKLSKLYLLMGEPAKSTSLGLKIQKMLKEEAFVKFTEKQLAGVCSKISEMDAELEKRKKELSKLSDKNKKLEENFEKNKIRLVETLGLFAAIIAFVIAGIVGLQGLTAAGIAISITGLTAGLVILVTLINIFTSPKSYIWGKVAVLTIAFLILIAWMVVTVFCKPAIFR